MVEIKALIAQVASGATLSREMAYEAFDSMMSGEVTPAQIGALLMGLRVRGETVDEITGAVRHACEDACRRRSGRCDRRGRDRRRRLRLVQHLDMRGFHRGGCGRPGCQAWQSRLVVAIRRGGRVDGPRSQD